MHLEKFVIDSNKPAHLSWWAEYFEVSEQTLLAAIDVAGVRSIDVQLYLHNRPADDSRAIGTKSNDVEDAGLVAPGTIGCS